MHRFHYFIKRVPQPYTHMFSYHCVRLPVGDSRIPEFEKTYAPIGWNMFVQYDYLPSTDQEIFKLRQRFQAYYCGEKFVIETPQLK
jgi:hypothetical protein